MDEFEQDIRRAGDALALFTEGPGRDAARILEDAFGEAGQSIQASLSRAAQTGQLDFRRMAESVLADLARIAAEAVIARSGLGQAGQTVNLNMAVGAGADAGSVVGAAGSIATVVAAAAARGGRFA